MNNLDKRLKQIPDILKEFNQWVVFQLKDRDKETGKYTKKTPLDPKPDSKGRCAKSDTSSTWGSFEEAVKFLKNKINRNSKEVYELGFALGCDSGIGGIDGDHCVDSNGNLNDNAKGIIEKADSYTEKSVSGIGFHILVFSNSDICAKSPVKNEESYEVYTPRLKNLTPEERKELFESNHKKYKESDNKYYRSLDDVPDVEGGRFFVVTGESIGEPKPIKEGTEAIEYVYEQFIKPRLKKPKTNNTTETRHGTALKIANQQWWEASSNENIDNIDGSEILPNYIEKLKPTGFYDRYDVKEATRLFEDAKKHVKKERAKTPLRPETFTDNGQAEVFKKVYGQYFCCSGGKGENVYFYDGVKWCVDSDLKLFEYFQKLAKDQIKETANNEDDKIYCKHALIYQNSRKITDAIKALKNKISIDSSKFDCDPYLLNTPEYTYNLKTGKRMGHKPDDYCINVTGCDINDNGKDIFDKYLDELTNHDEELQSYLQVIAGMAAIGEPSKVVIFFSDTPGTGKSTFILLLAKVLGDYAKPMNANVITREMNDGDKSDALSHLENVRFAHASELADDKTLDPQGIKKLASVDPIVCRQKNKTQCFFNPTHTAIIATNNIPESFRKDEAVMDRLIIIPFNKRFRGENDEIEHYEKKLFSESGGYIQKWIAEGAKRYIANPKIIYDLPESVRRQTKEYFEESDTIQLFIDECCTNEHFVDKFTGEVKEAKITRLSLFNGYSDFCKNNRIRCLKRTDFYREMEKKGYSKKRESKNYYIIGIRLKYYREPDIAAAPQTEIDITKQGVKENPLIN